MSKRFVFILFLFLILFSSQTIADSYADIEITLNTDGHVDIDGLTNYESFLNYDSSDFLTKEGKYWLLNITTEELFTNAVYKIILPENVVVNYLRVPDLLAIDTKDANTKISGLANNQQLAIIIQYQAEKESHLIRNMVFLVLVLISGILTWNYLMKSSSKKTFTYKGLSVRQREILRIISKYKEGIIQGEIEKKTRLPKSSLSRNINSLVKKNLIHKEQSGMSNKLFLKKK